MTECEAIVRSERARVALRNLIEVLRRAGASAADIVIGVRELATPQMKVEVEAVAVIGSGTWARVRP